MMGTDGYDGYSPDTPFQSPAFTIKEYECKRKILLLQTVERGGNLTRNNVPVKVLY